MMGVHYFSDEQVHGLQCHLFVDEVSHKAITYSESFKVHFITEYASGNNFLLKFLKRLALILKC